MTAEAPMGRDPLHRLVHRMRPHATSIFGELSALALRTGAINLGQGFPDVDGPDEIKEIAIAAIRDGSGNQYPPVHGLPDLRRAVAEHQRRFHGLEVDPVDGVVVATGASEAVVAALIGFLEAGDEAIVLEPWFDIYGAGISLAGARRVSVPLGPGFRLDPAAIRAAITSRTKVIVVNSPHNPTGVVLTRAELQQVADIAIEHDLVVFSDEVYEHLVFDGREHVALATLPGMWERTVTFGSAGKFFSFTGWKVGWASGPADLINPVRVVRQHLSYVSGGPFQPAVAAGLRLPVDYFRDFSLQMQSKRDRLTAGLVELGFGVVPSEGTYYVVTDVRPLQRGDGETFARLLPDLAGVVVIPVSVFCDNPDTGSAYVRWAFCKRESIIDEALTRLRTALR